MITIRKFDVGSAFRIGALITGVMFVLVFVPIFLCQIAFLSSIPATEFSTGARSGASFNTNSFLQGIGVLGGLFAFVCGGVIYMVIGGISAAVAAFAYNIIAQQFGGLQLEIDDPEERYVLPSSKAKNSFFDADFEKS